MTQHQQKKQQQPHDEIRKRKQQDEYGTPKPDMGGYIGRREGAGEEENPDSMPGGGG